ncbi:major facilitator superfamily domain-containing protein [Rhodotorula diobovata]|uniref:Major facilitator superfamily domain-containing protein n=1 Tax=Rhodotorula diobovata TaxID=5288 RepID=A0A5C5G2U6_9BASI|nr:major facilitator superfamily domain-containing protein [Rhodotorula diobovata]
MSSVGSLSPKYPPRDPFLRQKSRTPLLANPDAPNPAQYTEDESPSPTSPLLQPDEEGEGDGDGEGGAPTPLDATLEEVGMGTYQWQLFVLCGFSWWSDNAWLQCIAVILPRVQEHWGVSDRWIGLLSTSLFAGMMVGAWGWGSYSDAHGRVPAFNLTICFTAVFGTASAFAPTFGWLCFALFCLGTGVGGSMPTDGTLFLENTPKTKHYLLTALSVFFSLGAIFTSILGLVILPPFSCAPNAGQDDVPECDVQAENNGWRYMLGALGMVSVAMFVCRVLFFRLHESPKFLVASNRPSAAVIILGRISRINGDNKSFALSDVVDAAGAAAESPEDAAVAQAELDPAGEMPPARQAEDDVPSPSSLGEDDEADLVAFSLPPSYVPPSVRRERGKRPAWIERLPKGWRSGAEEYVGALEDLLEPKWRHTTLLVWAIWTLASAGYTIFNVFLPKFLEAKLAHEGSASAEATQEETLRDYVLYTVSGLPGSLLGAYLVETSLGRAKTLAYSTLATSAATFVFVFVTSRAGVVLSSMVVSLAATLMYAVIYSLTPEIFPTRKRGTATGIAAALSRLAGLVSPLLTGALLATLEGFAVPLVLSAACFGATAVCAWGLRGAEQRMLGTGRGKGGGGGLVH